MSAAPPPDQSPKRPTRRQHITREEEADRCLNHTEFSPGSQILAVVIFLLIVFGVPLTQHIVEIRHNLAERAKWSPASGQPEPRLAPQIYDVFKLLPTGRQFGQAKGFWGYWSLIPSAESISSFESSLKENSVLTTALLSPTQSVLSGYLGAGNEKAYIGKDGWLFYRPDVEYLTTPGFLEPAELKARSRGSTAIQPDPVKAILAFKDQLAKQGITLVVMPVSTKPMIVPEMLAGPSAEGTLLQNDSFQEFTNTLESNGVPVFDPTSALLPKIPGAPKTYLVSDTHWTPDAMHEVAMNLGEFLQKRCGLSPGPQGAFILQPNAVTNLGDIAEMLKLPPDQKIFAKQSVVTQRVLTAKGEPWQADRGGEVLLLGDSFSNIYSLGGMGWGTDAGFAEHLSYALGRSIDKIVMNAGGSFASRRELARQLTQGIDRLADKRVVVYEFSMRDLTSGDWRMIKLPPPLHAAPPPPVLVTRANPTASAPPVNIVMPPPTLPKTVGPKPTAGTAFKSFTVSPGAIDLSKGQFFRIEVIAPKGSWQVSILNAKDDVIRRLMGGSSSTEYTLNDSWNGGDIGGRPVPAGSYTVEVEGTRPNKTAMFPVRRPVKVVVSGKVPTTLPQTGPPPPASATNPPAPTATQQGKPGQKPLKGPVPTLGGKGLTAPPIQPNVNTSKTKPVPPQPVQGALTVTGRIAARAATPKPGSVPYKDCVIALQLTDLRVSGGTVKGPNIVVYVWGMKDNNLVDGAYAVGQTIRFKLTPWAQVDSKYGSYNRQELDNDDALSWQTFWGEIK